MQDHSSELFTPVTPVQQSKFFAAARTFCLPCSAAVNTPAAKESDRDVQLRLLRAFDLDEEFGPCVGLTRQQRIARAGAAPASH